VWVSGAAVESFVESTGEEENDHAREDKERRPLVKEGHGLGKEVKAGHECRRAEGEQKGKEERIALEDRLSILPCHVLRLAQRFVDMFYRIRHEGIILR